MKWRDIEQHIQDIIGGRFSVEKAQALAGGCINTCWAIEGNGQRFFIKLNRPDMSDMFAAEKEALSALANTHTVKVPKPVCYGETDDYAYLLLEYLPLAPISKKAQSILGEQLAALHAVEQPAFGWEEDNWIGATPQQNIKQNDWPLFWRDCRLRFQLELAAKNGFTGRLQNLGEKLQGKMKGLFAGYRPFPSLLHGDLWSGNAAMTTDEKPVIYDPACYWGDREADLAMTELFGGFGQDFYQAYQAVLPLDAGYGIRKDFYNLYHVLNHLNLFGGGYLHQAETIMEKLLSHIR